MNTKPKYRISARVKHTQIFPVATPRTAAKGGPGATFAKEPQKAFSQRAQMDARSEMRWLLRHAWPFRPLQPPNAVCR